MKKIVLVALFVLMAALCVACEPRVTVETIVSFEPNGGSAVAAKEREVNTFPVSRKSGYRIEGWYEDAKLTQRAKFPYVATQSVTLYAKWTSVQEGSPEIRYERTEDDKYLIAKSFDVESYSVVVPDAYFGTPVVGIKNGFLKTRAYVNVLYIGKNVASIDEDFYRCVHLQAFEVSGENPSFNVTEKALRDVKHNEIIAFPRDARVESVTVDCAVRKTTFYYNDDIKSVAIGENATADPAAFSELPNLTEINVNAGNGTFSSEDGILFSKDGRTLYTYPQGRKDAEAVVPDNVKTVAGGAFNGCLAKKITLGKNVERFDDYSFLRNLEAFALKAGNETYACFDGVLYDAEGKTLYRFPCAKGGTYTAEQTTERIWSMAFYQAMELTEVRIPKGVKEIGSFAFCECSALVKAVLEEESELESLGAGAFARCGALQKWVVTCRVPPRVDAYEFTDKNAAFRAVVPENAGELYALRWSDVEGASAVVEPSGLALATYTVTYNALGGSEVEAYHGVFVKKCPVTEREGMTFNGWFDNPDRMGFPVEFPLILTDHITLYADWQY